MEALTAGRRLVRIDRSGLNPFADLRLLVEYRSLFRELRPFAVLGFTIKPNIYGALAARALGIPFVANVSGLGTVFIKGGPLLALVVALYRAALNRAEVVFFQNPDDLKLFVDCRIVRPGQACLLPGSGVDLSWFEPQPLPDGQPVFLLIGRLLGDKGVREFVDAARRLKHEGLDARFQLLGPLDEQNRTAIRRDELDAWSGEGVVEYLGETDDVRPFIGRATAVVLPSYREGSPRSLLEAGAMGRPLIASNVPGCREVVKADETGFLCDPRDFASLAKAMRSLAELPATERQSMGEAARRLIEARFSEEIVVRAYLDALESFHASAS